MYLLLFDVFSTNDVYVYANAKDNVSIMEGENDVQEVWALQASDVVFIVLALYVVLFLLPRRVYRWIHAASPFKTAKTRTS